MFVDLRNDVKGACSLPILTFTTVLLLSSSTMGGMLATDTNAMPAWQGTQTYLCSGGNMGFAPFLHADVDYAVYAPGDFGLGDDPSGGEDYVYAYQIFHTGLEGNNPIFGDGDDSVKQFTVGLDGDEAADNIGYLVGTGLAPDSHLFNTTSAVWNYDANVIPPGDPAPHSAILLFTSPNSPEWDTGVVLGVGALGEEALPSPIPEPGTLCLLGWVATALFFSCLARRRSV